MKKNYRALIVGLVIGCISVAKGDALAINQVGVGARAFSFANNYVAAANDMSSIFWNPAALSFIPVREIQVSLDMLSNTSNTDFLGSKENSDVRRIRLANIGYLSAVPTGRGGLTFAAAYQSPYVFDDNPSFFGNYIDKSNNSIKLNKDYRSFGSLNFWSGAFGLQVAPGLGIGAALSLVTGSQKINYIFTSDTDGIATRTNNDMYNAERSYVGYDVRLGLLYSPIEKIRLGARLVLPQTIWFTEDPPIYEGFSKGQLFSSYSGAIGISTVLPIATLSSEVRFRAPYDYVNPEDVIPSTSPAHSSRVGAGLGAEIPLFIKNALVRVGYSWDQYDTHPFAIQYDGDTSQAVWESDGVTVNQDRNLLTAGLAYVSSGISIEASYGYQFWKLNTNGTLSESDHIQRFLVSLSTRF
jgi:long-subunit fatty acid transport protein